MPIDLESFIKHNSPAPEPTIKFGSWVTFGDNGIRVAQVLKVDGERVTISYNGTERVKNISDLKLING